VQVPIQSGSSALNLEVEQFGTPDRGTIILIMGLGTQLIAWPLEFCQGLAAAGYRVIRFDNRDVGLSSKFESAHVPGLRSVMLRRLLHLSTRAPYTLVDMGEDTIGLMDSLHIDKAHIVGGALGGRRGQRVASYHATRHASFT
jgi:pimeloyl-ACP methyl ester carboxylesterase